MKQKRLKLGVLIIVIALAGLACRIKPSIATVAVLDTGIDRNHEVFVDKIVAGVNLSNSPTVDDIYGHGTHVAGIIVNDNIRIMNVKVADDRGKCDAGQMAQGIIWAVDKGANIINISLFLIEPAEVLEEAVIYAQKRGVLMIVAAGSNVGAIPTFPAYYPECISVTAVKEDGSRVPLANSGTWINVAAPGWEIYSALPGNEYGYKTGTSQAAAYVSEMAATLYSTGSSINTIREIIESELNVPW